MILITEIRGTIFTVLLSDNTALTLTSGESKAVKNELISDSVKDAEKLGCISLKEIQTEKKSSNNKKNGGAVENE